MSYQQIPWKIVDGVKGFYQYVDSTTYQQKFTTEEEWLGRQRDSLKTITSVDVQELQKRVEVLEGQVQVLSTIVGNLYLQAKFTFHDDEGKPLRSYRDLWATLGANFPKEIQ